jgi:hypothetical protein
MKRMAEDPTSAEALRGMLQEVTGRPPQQQGTCAERVLVALACQLLPGGQVDPEVSCGGWWWCLTENK